MNKIISIVFTAFFVNIGFSQFFVNDNTTVYSGDLFDLYTNEDFLNEGEVTFNGDASFYVDSGLDNRNGVINYNDVTLHIGSGTSLSSSNDDFYFKDRDSLLQIGEQVRFVVLNKLGGTTDVLEGHLGINDWFESTAGTLTAGRRVTLLNRNSTDVATASRSTGGTAILETERFIPARRAFRLISPSATTSSSIRANWQEDASAWNDNPSPGFGTHITGIGEENPVAGTNDGQNGFDWQPSGNPSLFEYNNTSGVWFAIPNTNLQNLEAGNPLRLMIRGSRDVNIQFNISPPSNTNIRESGTLTRGTVTYNDPNFGDEEDDFIFIGNPYHSVVDLETVFNNSSNIKPFVAIWEPALGGTPVVGQAGGRGAYVLVDILNNETNTVESAITKFLQPKQAAFFYADGNGAPSIVFSENDKSTNDNLNQVFSVNSDFNLNLLLYDENSFNQNSTSRDAFLIRFRANANNEVDANDVPKPNNLDENLARIHEGILLSIEERNLPVNGEKLGLFINQYKNTNYVFKSILENIPANTNAYLIDHYLNETHVLNEGITTINFSIDPNINASIAYNRFSLSFGLDNLGNISFDKNQVQVYPNPSEGIIHIKSSINIKQISVYSLDGKLLLQENKNSLANYTMNLGMLEAGVYLINIVNEEQQTFTTKLIIK